MIDINKKHRTRDGHEVRIYAVNVGHSLPIHGAVLDGKEWRIWAWWGTGRSQDKDTRFDLIEMRPRIQRTVWLNVYSDSVIEWLTKKQADDSASSNRLACVKVEIDCEEGDGL
jgi:hypothetical protein